MKLHSVLLNGILGAAILFAGGTRGAFADSREAPARRSAPADVRPPVAAQPGTPAEAREYEQRETKSPEVQDFSGGEVIVGISLLGVLLIVLIVVLIMRD